jgi:hypothetical protein
MRRLEFILITTVLLSILHIDDVFSQLDSCNTINANITIRDGGPNDPRPCYIIKMDTLSIKTDSSFIQHLDPKWVKKVEVLKDEKYKDIYDPPIGEAVILIYMKKKYFDDALKLLEK